MRDEPTVAVGEAWHDAPVGPGARLGRYQLTRLVGAGGMGIVFAARDPELDREIAVKVLRPRARELDRAGADRLRREGIAMARLTHPNVIRVYDVGIEGEHVFVAMELVRGTDLATWLDGAPRTDAAIVAAFVQAGRGLAAAHDAGLVHRDFKPQNVLVGDDGRVLVTDFGLARDAASAADDGPLAGGSPAASPLVVTEGGAVVGTPAYMAPEQRRGVVDTRADQFSFCVALARALTRAGRPAPPDAPDAHTSTAAAPAAATDPAARDAPPATFAVPAHLPARLRTALARGLRTDPGERFPSMHELLARIDPRAGRRRPWLLVAGAALVAAVATAWFLDERATGAPCPAPTADVLRVWSPVRQALVQARLHAVDPAHGDDRQAAAARLIDPYLGAWSTMHVETCQATRVRGHQSDELLDLRMSCLARGLQAVDGAVARLALASDAREVEAALRGLAQLEPLDECGDAERVRRRMARPTEPGARQAVSALERDVAQVRLDVRAGRLTDVVDRAAALVARARALAHPPVLAAALDVLALAQLAVGVDAAGERTLRELAQVAAAARDDRTEAIAWIQLVALLGGDLVRPDDALALVPAASAAVLRAGDPLDLRVDLLRSEASVLDMGPRIAEAMPRLDEALRLIAAADRGPAAGALALLHGKVLREVAWIHMRQAEYDRAIAVYEQAIQTDRALFGPGSSGEALARHSIGEARKRSGRHAEAIAAYRESAAINQKLGATPRLAQNVLGIATAQGDLGDWPGAIATFAEARALLERAGAAQDATLIPLLAGLARAHGKLGHLDDAERTYGELIAVFDRVGTASINAPIAFHNRGELRRQHGRLDDAIADFERAATLFPAVAGADTPFLLYPRVGKGVALEERGDHAAALAALTPVIEAADAKADPVQVARARAWAGRARMASPATRARGLAEIRAARPAIAAGVAAGDEDAAAYLRDVDRWLAAR